MYVIAVTMAMNLTTRMVQALKLGETASRGSVGITSIATTQGAIHTLRASWKEASRLPFASTTKSWSAAMMMIDMPIQSILDDNRFGFRPQDTILGGRINLTVQTRNLHDCIWHVMEATLRANEKSREQQLAYYR